MIKLISMNRSRLLSSLWALAAALFCAGCANTQPLLPRSYLEGRHDLSVAVVSVHEKPQMSDLYGRGGMAGILTATTRTSMMRETMAGIQGETVTELVRQEVTRRLRPEFNIVEHTNDLQLTIRIDTFGFFVPTVTGLGIKAGAYQFQILARVEVLDSKQQCKRLGFSNVIGHAPLGNKPSPELMPDALSKSVEDFATAMIGSMHKAIKK